MEWKEMEVKCATLFYILSNDPFDIVRVEFFGRLREKVLEGLIFAGGLF
jgi:hypothetical protein